ncbi:MAG: GlxA family transcriptional regulator [Candidatus Korobacteraceae bacterium]|jgi:transcriptional regulator GlxA family with amidase domain
MELITEKSEKYSKLSEWPTRRVVLLVLPGANLMTLAGPVDVFTRASTALVRAGKRSSAAYEVALLTAGDGPLMTPSGFGVTGGRPWAHWQGPIDTLLVVAGAAVAQSRFNPELLAWLRMRATDVRRIGSVCAGAFALGAAGILDGRRATTHWELADALARRHPRALVDGDRIFTQDGNVWTSAGVSAGTDLALALVEEDHGHAVALDIARRMVLFMRRDGGQKQFSSQLAAQAADHQPIRELVAWMSEHLHADLSVPVLARQIGMSERNFSRVFKQQLGTTPARFVARLRTEAAKAKLAATPEKLEAVAQSAGFGDGETLRRNLRRASDASQSTEARVKYAWA